jgi:hypothetical protein
MNAVYELTFQKAPNIPLAWQEGFTELTSARWQRRLSAPLAHATHDVPRPLV